MAITVTCSSAGDIRVCFAGDTAYTNAFARLQDPQHPLDLMIMPIGAYDPWIRAHCSPEQAVAMARADVRADSPRDLQIEFRADG